MECKRVSASQPAFQAIITQKFANTVYSTIKSELKIAKSYKEINELNGLVKTFNTFINDIKSTNNSCILDIDRNLTKPYFVHLSHKDDPYLQSKLVEDFNILNIVRKLCDYGMVREIQETERSFFSTHLARQDALSDVEKYLSNGESTSLLDKIKDSNFITSVKSKFTKKG